MKLQLVIIVVLAFFLPCADAQKKRPKVPLETGFERKLGMVYKTVGE